MTAAIAQMFAGGGPLNEDTVFDIEFTDEHVADGVYCQVQFSVTPLGGNDAIGVDWGDGTKQDWPKAQTLLAHNWDARGRYRVRFDRRLKWFRFTTAYAIDAATRRIRATVRPLVYPLQWGDFVESANGTYCGWRGVRGTVPKWGPSFTDCTGVYDGCTGLGGAIPAWPKAMTACDQCYQNTLAEGTIPAWPANVASGRM